MDAAARARKALGNIFFVDSSEPLSTFVPDYWSAIMRRLVGDYAFSGTPTPMTLDDCPAMGSPQNFCGPKSAISPPTVISAPDPAYDKVAESLKFQGVVVLWTVVDITGHATHIKIAKPFGVGLDEKAVAALSRWRFNPATRDGQPVPVQINVEVNFRLH